MQLHESIRTRLLDRLNTLHTRGEGTIGDMLQLS